MSKRSIYTTITPLPVGITRQTVLETLHTHVEMIDLNPLVEERHPIKPPPQATPEEFHCQWYSMTDKIQYLPGGLYSGKVTYNACFHDLANGVQTHIYAPMGLDIRGCWTIGGSLPGEPQAPVEMGKGIPQQGLYLREDTDVKCNVFLMKFVKKNLRNSHATLVQRMVVKAQLYEKALANDRMSEASHSSSPHLQYASSLHSSQHGPSPLASPGLSQTSMYSNPVPAPSRPNPYAGPSGSHPYPQQFDPRLSHHGYGGSPGYQMDPAYANANPYMQPQMQMQHGQLHPQMMPAYDPRMSYQPQELANNDMAEHNIPQTLAANAASVGSSSERPGSKRDEKDRPSSSGPPVLPLKHPVDAVELEG